MIKSYILFFFFSFLSITIFSQTQKAVKTLDVYPIRVNHKWGYAKFYPSFIDILVQPRYDYIGDVNLAWSTTQRNLQNASPFKVFEIDEKVGLLDANLNEFLPNKYNRIRPLSPQYFAVEKDSLFVLINRDEKEFFDGEKYSDIKSDRVDDRLLYFFVKKNRKWGVRKLDGTLILDYKYTNLRSTALEGYFLAKLKHSDFNWILVDAKGKKVLPKAYEDIIMISQDLIAIKERNDPFFNLYRKKKNGYKKGTVKYSTVEKINSTLFVTLTYNPDKDLPLNAPKPKNYVELWDLQKNKRVGSYEAAMLSGKTKHKVDPWFYALNDKYSIIKRRARNKKSIEEFLVSPSGNIISSSFDTIFRTAKEDVYFIGKKMQSNGERWQWGLLAPEKDLFCSLECKYNEIIDFADDIAILNEKGNYGAIAIRGDSGTLLKCRYASILKSDKNTLQAQTMDGLTATYKLTDNLEFIEEALYEKVMLFSKNVKPQLREIEPNSLDEIESYSASTFETEWLGFSFKYIKDKLCLYYTNSKEGKTKDSLVLNTGIKELASRMLEISPNIFAFHHKNKIIKTAFTKKFFGGSVELISFYDFKKNTLGSAFQIIGFRPFREGYKYTTFLTPDGKMGLMDRNGEQLMANGAPVRYAFIGDFYAGRARIFTGNELFLDRKNKVNLPSQFVLHTQSSFKYTFHVVFSSKGSSPKRKKKKRKRQSSIYALMNTESAKWGYIDSNGKLIIETDAEFVFDFNDSTNIAKSFKRNNRNQGVGPEADVGLIDTSGNIVLDVDYNDIREYPDFYQVAVDSTPTFYFTKKGHQLFINRTKLRPFTGGLSLFSDKENKWGYVNTLGEVAIPPQYSIARPFSDGVAMVVDDSGYCSFIDAKGTLLFRSTFTAKQWRGVGDFHEGRVWFKRENGWFWGCYNENGEEIISPKFHYQIKKTGKTDHTKAYQLPMDFSKGVAAVFTIGDDGKAYATIIDSTGTKVTKDQNIESISRFDKYGLASYTIKGSEEIGVINYRGEKLTIPLYTKIGTFKTGYAKVLGKNKKWGLINDKGEQLLPCVHTLMGEISEGLVSVKASYDKGWSFVDLQNKVKIIGPFENVNPFKGGVTLVSYKGSNLLINKDGEQIYILTGKPIFFSEGILGIAKHEAVNNRGGVYFYADDAGNNIFGRNFSTISPFRLGVAQVRRIPRVKKGQKRKREFFGAINKRGIMIVPPKFRNLHLQPDGNIIINPQLFFGIANKEGKMLLEPIYDRIQFFSKDNILRVEQGEKVGYVQIKEKKKGKEIEIEWIWELQY